MMPSAYKKWILLCPNTALVLLLLTGQWCHKYYTCLCNGREQYGHNVAREALLRPWLKNMHWNQWGHRNAFFWLGCALYSLHYLELHKNSPTWSGQRPILSSTLTLKAAHQLPLGSHQAGEKGRLLSWHCHSEPYWHQSWGMAIAIMTSSHW